MVTLDKQPARKLSAEDFIADGRVGSALSGDAVVAGSAVAGAEPRRSLSIVIPVFNEARGIPILERRLTRALDALGHGWDVIFVDDGSSDQTLAELRALHQRDARYSAIALSRNFGKEIAVAAGLKETKGEGVVIMDGDLQHPPEAIAAFVERWNAGYDIVYGQRTDRDTDTAANRAASRAFYKLFRSMSGTSLPPGAGDAA